eukprot:TRINITY_DN2060_c0_g1_i2.p1 TRINITY_DN2060_c0_g1~~TRINITY_DN2060_c0_g1_i2.p1  ORF type:complete len:415 (-),score=87.00 TRINITY_DN2060_c0_g1_i2:91-1335(-)
MADQQPETLIQVRFVTKLEDLKVDDIHFSIPARLQRKDLSELINSLLQTETPVNFDFLISNEFLRTSLQKYIESHAVSTELVLDVEYVISTPLPEPSEDNKGPDWMMSVAGGHPDFVVSGCANGTVQLWGVHNRDISLSSTDFASSVTSVAWAVAHKDSKRNMVIAGSKDNTIRTYKIEEDNTWKPMGLFKGHQNSVEAVAADPRAVMFCSGGWDSSIIVWSYEDVSDNQQSDTGVKKRKKQSLFQEQTHVAIMNGHKQAVSSVVWPIANKIYSGSWDHTIACWDVHTGAQDRSLSGNHPVYKVDFCEKTGLLISSHQDRSIRLWDPRVSEGAVSKKNFTRHQEMVSDVKWSPFSESHFASSGHDGKVYLWDTRSSVPLHLLCKHDGKALSVSWMGAQAVASGGSDGIVKFTKW